MRLRTVIGCALVLAVAIGGHVALSQNAQERSIMASKGASVVAQIRPSDVAVKIVSSRAMPLDVLPPPGVSLARWITQFSPEVWLVQISLITGALNDAGDFVDSEVTAKVLTILKDTGAYPVAPGGEIRFKIEGGEIRVGNVPVRAVVPWRKQPEMGRQYIVFAAVNQDDQTLRVDGLSMFEAMPNGFVSMKTGGPGVMQPLDGSPAETLQTIRAAAAGK
jgi:hypothetical protein